MVPLNPDKKNKNNQPNKTLPFISHSVNPAWEIPSPLRSSARNWQLNLGLGRGWDNSLQRHSVKSTPSLTCSSHLFFFLSCCRRSHLAFKWSDSHRLAANLHVQMVYSLTVSVNFTAHDCCASVESDRSLQTGITQRNRQTEKNVLPPEQIHQMQLYQLEHDHSLLPVFDSAPSGVPVRPRPAGIGRGRGLLLLLRGQPHPCRGHRGRRLLPVTWHQRDARGAARSGWVRSSRPDG